MSEETIKVNKTSKLKKNIKELGPIILLVFVFRSVFFEPFKIPSGSMIPTLAIGDFILVNKFSYGFKLPFSDMFGDPTYLLGESTPERGDVIVFKYPEDTSFNYIKRVIGLPGDTIEVVNKVVYVNDKAIVTKEIDGKEIVEDMDAYFKSYNFKFFKTNTGKHEHITQVDTENSIHENFPRIKVPQGHYFVMGDNRDFSADSRFWGFVPFGHIKGKAILVWFSLDFPWPWEDANKHPFVMRPWRIGTIID